MYSSLDLFFLQEIMIKSELQAKAVSSHCKQQSIAFESYFALNVWNNYEHLSWKSHHRQAAKFLALLNIIRRKIIAVIYATFAVAKRKPEKKNQAYTGFEPLTSQIPVQRSDLQLRCVYNCDDLPPNNSSLRSSHI